MQNKPKINLPFTFLLCTIVLASFFLTNSFNPLGTRTTTPSEAIVISPKPFKPNKSIEIHTLSLITVTPTPATDNQECTVPTDVSNDLNRLVPRISQKYGVDLSGDALTVDKAQLTYESMCLAFKSPAYQANLNSLQYHVKVVYVNKGQCFAWTYANPARIEMWEPCSALVDKYILIHELTHQMQNGAAAGRNAQWSEWQAIWEREKNHRIPTGPCVIEDPGDGGECEADAIAEYIYYKVYRNSWGGSPPGGPNFANYPTDWPTWYAFVRDNIFGGVTY